LVKLAWSKLLANSGQIVQNDLPRLGGTWVGSFFLVGLLAPGQERRSRRLGLFLVMSLVFLALDQALGRTAAAVESTDINSGNLLVLLVPAVWAFGTRFFYCLLGQFETALPQVQKAVIVIFGGLTCWPMMVAILALNRAPVAYPPYYPPSIQAAAGFLKRDELMMSDIPWAVAWYGGAQCVWLPQSKGDFLAINDRQKPIQALYLTHAGSTGSIEGFYDWIRAGEENWGGFIMSCLLQKEQGKPGPPPDFPLEFWQKGWPQDFLLTAREKPVNAVDSR